MKKVSSPKEAISMYRKLKQVLAEVVVSSQRREKENRTAKRKLTLVDIFICGFGKYRPFTKKDMAFTMGR